MFLNETTSTMDEVKKSKYNSEDKLAIYAGKQFKGRGRRSNNWISDEGNLFISLRIKKTKIKKHFMINYLTSIAVYETIIKYLSKKNVFIKWPNDILVNNKKIAGILIETTNTQGVIEDIIVGVGINIKNAPKDLDRETTCICSESKIKDIKLNNIVNELIKNYLYWEKFTDKKGYQNLLNEWMQRSIELNSKIKFNNKKEVVEGIYKGINIDGSIKLIINNRSYNFFNADLEF